MLSAKLENSGDKALRAAASKARAAQRGVTRSEGWCNAAAADTVAAAMLAARTWQQPPQVLGQSWWQTCGSHHDS